MFSYLRTQARFLIYLSIYLFLKIDLVDSVTLDTICYGKNLLNSVEMEMMIISPDDRR